MIPLTQFIFCLIAVPIAVMVTFANLYRPDKWGDD